MSIFLFSLASIPPLGGWFAKLVIFGSLASAGTTSGYVLAILVAVNSVIAFFYYARVMRYMWFEDTPTATRPRSRSRPPCRSRWC